MVSESMDRIVVFTGDLNYSVRSCVRDILAAFDNVTVLVLLHTPQRRPARLIRNQLRNLKKHGPLWVPYQGREILTRLTRRAEPTDALGMARPGGRVEIEALLASGRVQMTALPSVNGAMAEALLRDWRPDLGLSLAAPILKPAVFALPRLGTVNLHKGKLPEYRGMPPAFWEVKDKQPFVGCTVHQVEAGLDTGAIVAETRLPVAAFSTPAGLRVALDRLGNQLVVDAIRALRDGTATGRVQTGAGRTNSTPPLAVARKLSRELKAREGKGGLRPHLKDIAFNVHATLQAARRGVASARRPPTLAILLYHRVNDELRDHVTIGIEQFDEQVAYLRRHWPVVPLRAVLRGEVDYRGKRPLVCVTFDDGYRDNYDFAAPILLKHRLPATFFVSTGKLTEQTPFQHDLEKLGRGLPNMTWDQVREMHREGLDFGSHTVNHVNLGTVNLEEARTELVESRDTLRQELGQEEFLFAYPFGGEKNITPEARALVKETGYRCCCSAYGGVNKGALDEYNVLRMGVNFGFSIAALRSRLNGWS